jgi:hypothetical protein
MGMKIPENAIAIVELRCGVRRTYEFRRSGANACILKYYIGDEPDSHKYVAEGDADAIWSQYQDLVSEHLVLEYSVDGQPRYVNNGFPIPFAMSG